MDTPLQSHYRSGNFRGKICRKASRSSFELFCSGVVVVVVIQPFGGKIILHLLRMGSGLRVAQLCFHVLLFLEAIEKEESRKVLTPKM
jgi:hypothetical protein